MVNQNDKSVIQRKALEGRSDFDARVMSPVKALRLSLAKVAKRLYGLALGVSMVEQSVLPQAELQEALTGEGMLLLLDGATGQRGALRLDPAMVTTLVEVQVLGHVREGDAVVRPFTRTDAAMMQPMVDALLDGFDSEQTGGDAEYVPRAFRYGDVMEDARSLVLALPEPEYEQFRVSLDIDGGARSGVVWLLLPKLPEPEIAEDAPAPKTGRRGVSLKRQVMDAPAMLDAVVARMQLPLNEICALTPGMVLPLETDCLGKTRIVATGGHVVGEARLGQMNGLRAIRMLHDSEDDPNMLPDPASNGAGLSSGGSAMTARPEPAAVPDLPDLPDLPDIPDLPDLAELAAVPLEMEGVPDMAPAPLPDLPIDLPDAGDGPDPGDLLASAMAGMAPPSDS